MKGSRVVYDLIEELQRLQEVEDLLDAVLIECGEYGYSIKGMSDKTLMRVQRHMSFDDSE